MNSMKQVNIIVVLALLCCLLQSIQAQDNNKFDIYKISLKLNNTDDHKTGLLYGFNDSSIIITNSLNVGNLDQELNLVEYNFTNIDYIVAEQRYRMKKSTIKGFWFGFIVGGIATVAYHAKSEGFISMGGRSDPTTMEVVRFFGPILGCAATGAIIGASIGSVKIEMSIYGQKEHFDELINHYGVKLKLRSIKTYMDKK